MSPWLPAFSPVDGEAGFGGGGGRRAASCAGGRGAGCVGRVRCGAGKACGAKVPSLAPSSTVPARSFLPHVGRVTIVMNDYPMFKYALIAVLGIFVLTSKE